MWSDILSTTRVVVFVLALSGVRISGVGNFPSPYPPNTPSKDESCGSVGCPDPGCQYCEVDGTCRQRPYCPCTPCSDPCDTCDNGSCQPKCGECEECVVSYVPVFGVYICEPIESCPCVPCSDDCQVCEDGKCVPIRTCPCRPCENDCEVCVDGECVTDETCPCLPCSDDCEVCVDGECVLDETCPCQPCDECQICDDGECIPDETCPCQPCDECQICDDGECIPDETCPCQPCDECQICDDGECIDDLTCPCEPCSDCEICDDGTCVEDTSCPCSPCGECEVCRNGRCREDRTCPNCRECEVYELCVDGECLSLEDAVGCPSCGECELCDPETAECIPDLTCPCVPCRPTFDCIEGQCQQLDPVECPQCPDCHKCDPFTGECIPSCPCVTCPVTGECFIPGFTPRTSAVTFNLPTNTPTEECGYCLSKIPQACEIECSNYWEVCDLRTGRCVPSCNITQDCDEGETCFNELCIDLRTCERICTEADCYLCNPTNGWCESSWTCNPECRGCGGGEFCSNKGYCEELVPRFETMCPIECGGCTDCDFTTNGKCFPCNKFGNTCEPNTGFCLPFDSFCASGEKAIIDAMFLYTYSSIEHLSTDVCGDDSPNDLHMKRYIAQRIKEANIALERSCIRAEIRVVNVRQLPEEMFEQIPCSPTEFCGDEADLVRGDSADTDFSLANLFLSPFDSNSQSILNITESEVQKYGADIVVFLYDRSDDWKGGLASISAGKVMVPLRMRLPCGVDGDVTQRNADMWYELPNQIGHLMVRGSHCLFLFIYCFVVLM